MNTGFTLLAATVALTTLFSTSVLADTVLGGPVESGAYATARVGYGKVDSIDAGLGSGAAGGLGLGYKFMKNVAVDFAFTDMPKTITNNYYLHLALTGIYPLGDGNWDVYAKVGPALGHGARLRYLPSDSEITMFFGLGFTYWLVKNFGLILDGTTTTRNNNLPAMHTATLGFTYFF